MFKQQTTQVIWGTLRAISFVLMIALFLFASLKSHAHSIDFMGPSTHRLELEHAEKEKRAAEGYRKVQEYLEANYMTRLEPYPNETADEARERRREWFENHPNADIDEPTNGFEPTGRDYSESVDYEASHCG